jgi:hypothetical protein
MLRAFILMALLILAPPSGLYAQKILCLSDYQGGGKAATLERLVEAVAVHEGPIDTLIVAGDYIDADDLLVPFWTRLGKPLKRHPLKMHPLERHPPVVLFARGNHDEAASLVMDFSDPFAGNTHPPPIHLPDKEPGQITAYRENDILFIVTDPFLSFSRKGYTKRQLDRLETLLSRSTYTHAFVVGHLPAFPKFRHIGKSIDHFTYARDRLVRILARYHAHFIHGHDHYANMIRVGTSLHIDCGTINGGYGSAVVIDTDAEKLGVRMYEVYMTDKLGPPQMAFQFIGSGVTIGGRRPLQGKGKGGVERFHPVHLWGSRQVPHTRPRFLEMGLMEANLEYLMDWINYFL